MKGGAGLHRLAHRRCMEMTFRKVTLKWHMCCVLPLINAKMAASERPKFSPPTGPVGRI